MKHSETEKRTRIQKISETQSWGRSWFWSPSLQPPCPARGARLPCAWLRRPRRAVCLQTALRARAQPGVSCSGLGVARDVLPAHLCPRPSPCVSLSLQQHSDSEDRVGSGLKSGRGPATSGQTPSGKWGGPLRIRAPSSHLRNTAPAATLCSRGAGAQGHLPCSPRFPSPQAEEMGHLQSQVSCQVDRTRGGGTCVGGGGGQRGRPCAVAGEGPGAEGAHAHPGRGEPHTTTLPGLWVRAWRRGARLPRAERGGDSAAPAALRAAPPDPPIPRAGRSGPPRLRPAAPTLPPLALGLEWPLLLLAGPGGSGTSQDRFLGLEFCPWL